MSSLLAVAVAPGLAICIYIFYKDKFEREPKRLLLLAFFLGALSTIPALILETGVQRMGIIYSNSVAKTAVYAFIGVAIIEEAVKFFMVFKFLYPRKDFDEPFDGITYCVMASMGFATVENIAYVVDGGASVAILRMFTAVPAHAAFGVIMGYYLGLAKFNTERSNTYLAFALFIPSFLHAAYDFPLMLDADLVPWIGSYKVFGAIATLIVALWLSRRAIRIHQFNSPFKNDSDHLL